LSATPPTEYILNLKYAYYEEYKIPVDSQWSFRVIPMDSRFNPCITFANSNYYVCSNIFSVA
jgi:hypothetical protein